MWSETNQQLTQFAADLLGPDGARRPAAAGPTSCCAPAATRSRAAPPRCSRTSSPSACSACPRPARRRDMDFDLTEDQREIKDVARELLAARSPMAKVREAAEAGQPTTRRCGARSSSWAGRASPSPSSTAARGSGAVELAVLLEELGYACAATPFLSTAVAAAVIQAAGTDEQRERWLPGLVTRRADAPGSGTRRAGRRRPTGADVVVLLDGDDGPRWSPSAADRAAGDDRPDPPLRPRARRRRAARPPARRRGSARRSPPRWSASASGRWR